MKVPQLLDEVRQRVPEKAPFGTRYRLTSVVQTAGGVHDIGVAARIDADGGGREQFWCDAVRVKQPVLMRLTCPEGECPHVVQVRAQWVAFRGRRGQRFTARPARFPCFTRCPHGAHPPMSIEKSGFDLFDDTGCVGGGVVEAGGFRRPRLATLREAQAFVPARHLETLAAISQARDAAGGHA